MRDKNRAPTFRELTRSDATSATHPLPMKFEIPIEKLIPDLLKLAELLDAKADAAEKEAKVHALTAGEGQDALKSERRAVSGRYYAKAAREAAGRLRARKATAAFNAPTLEEVRAYASAKHPTWPAQDLESWYSHFESVGWRVGSGAGKPMKDWRAAVDGGVRRWKGSHPAEAAAATRKAAGETEKNGDPQGWGEFCQRQRQPYKPYRFAIQWLQRAFDREKKAPCS